MPKFPRTDVLGSKLDDELDSSLYGINYAVSKHIHSISYCYPSLTAGVTVNGGAGAWALSAAFAEIIPADTIASPYDIHFVNIGQASAADTYQIEWYYGEANTFCGCTRFTRAAGTTVSSQQVVQTPLIPANAKLTCKVASASGGDNITITVSYHTY